MNILSKDIITTWGLQKLPKNKQDEAVSRIGRTIYQAILVRSLDELPTDDEKGLDELLDKNETTPEEVLKFLKKKISNFDEVVKEECKNIKEDVVVSI